MSTEAATPLGVDQVPYLGGPWFLSPGFEREIAERGLDPETEAIVRSFALNGYVILDDLGIDDFDSFADQVESDLEPLHEGARYNRIMDAWTVSEPIRRLATSPKILGLLETMYGRRPIPFQTLNFLRGSQQHTHSDAYHFHSYPKHFMCGVWVAFEDVDDDNGPLNYYPGSHRLPDYDFLCPSREGVLHDYVDELIPRVGLTKELGYLRRGQALIWAANLLHGGEPVRKPDHTRKSQVTHCYFDGCSYLTPFRSDFARGKIFFRQITDVTTGKLHTLRIPTGRVRPPLTARAVTLQRRLGRMVGRGYVRY
jgi:hypothetical protein